MLKSSRKRLDYFFRDASCMMLAELRFILKLILILSHDQAIVERSCNISKIVFKENI